MREVLFYRWRVPDERRPGKFTTTRHRLTVEEAHARHPGAQPEGEPELRKVPDGPGEFSYTGAFQHRLPNCPN
jgi:hypothetical protein